MFNTGWERSGYEFGGDWSATTRTCLDRNRHCFRACPALPCPPLPSPPIAQAFSAAGSTFLRRGWCPPLIFTRRGLQPLCAPSRARDFTPGMQQQPKAAFQDELYPLHAYYQHCSALSGILRTPYSPRSVSIAINGIPLSASFLSRA